MNNTLNAYKNEEKEYIYKVYGLILKSNLMIPELIPAILEETDKIDVAVSFDEVPKEIHHSVFNAGELQFSENEMYFYVEGLAHFYIAYGNTIIIEPIEYNQLQRLRVYLLGGCIGTILAQRKIIAIHGSSVLINEFGIIFTGNSGAGKSSITSALISNGNKFLSDDITAIVKNDMGQFFIQPSYPQLKLCNDMKEIIRYEMVDKGILDAVRSKHAIYSETGFMNCEIPLYGMFVITVHDANDVNIQEITGTEKITTLLSSIYSINAIKYAGLKPDYFKQCLEIINKIKIYKLSRPLHGFTLQEQIKQVRSVLDV